MLTLGETGQFLFSCFSPVWSQDLLSWLEPVSYLLLQRALPPPPRDHDISADFQHNLLWNSIPWLYAFQERNPDALSANCWLPGAEHNSVLEEA